MGHLDQKTDASTHKIVSRLVFENFDLWFKLSPKISSIFLINVATSTPLSWPCLKKNLLRFSSNCLANLSLQVSNLKGVLSKAKERNMLMTKEVLEYNELKNLINSNFGFVKTYWCGGNECEERIKNETGADIRLIANFEEKITGKCIICEKEAIGRWVYFSKAY